MPARPACRTGAARRLLLCVPILRPSLPPPPPHSCLTRPRPRTPRVSICSCVLALTSARLQPPVHAKLSWGCQGRNAKAQCLPVCGVGPVLGTSPPPNHPLPSPSSFPLGSLPRRAGDSFANPIDLGSSAQVMQNGDSTGFPDSALGECNDPTDYNATTGGDGGDVVSMWC